MVTRVFMAPRRRGMSVEDFQDHWRGPHAALALRLPGLRRYVQNHAVLRDGLPLLPYPGFDCLPELDFEDLSAMEEALFSPARDPELEDDEAAFLEPGRGGAVVGEATTSGGKPEPGAVKLLTFFRAHSLSSTDELEASLRGPYAEAVARARPLGHEQLFAMRATGLAEPPCDAIDTLWFASPEAAQVHVTSHVAAAAAFELAGRAQAVGCVIARPVRIL